MADQASATAPAPTSSAPTPHTTQAQSQVTLPRIIITFCTQCKWLLRAAWLQQELLSTFSTTLGEVALIPSTGGIFRIHISHRQEGEVEVKETLLWDRKAEGGFPEAKVLKQRVRDVVEPGRGLGHSDTPSARVKGEGEGGKVDLAGKVREEGPRNPLVRRMRPEMGAAKGEGGGDVEGGGEGRECEECR